MTYWHPEDDPDEFEARKIALGLTTPNAMNENTNTLASNDAPSAANAPSATSAPKLQSDVVLIDAAAGTCKLQPTPFPWVAGDQPGEVLDAEKFDVLQIADVCVLDKWHEVEGVMHWGNRPGVTYHNRSDARVQANTDLVLAIPSMLEALQMCQAYFNRPLVFTGAESAEVRATLSRVNNALAQAQPTYSVNDWLAEDAQNPASENPPTDESAQR